MSCDETSQRSWNGVEHKQAIAGHAAHHDSSNDGNS